MLFLAPVRLRRLGLVGWLDGIVVGLGAAAVCAVAFDAISRMATGNPLSIATYLAYPVADLILLGLICAVAAMQGWRLSRPWWFLVGGCLLLVIADTAYLLAQASGSYVDGGIYDVGWPAAFALLAAAGWQRADITANSPLASLPALALPAVVSGAAITILVYRAVAADSIPVLAAVLAAAALIAAVVRTLMSVRQLEELVRSRQLAVTDDLTGLGNRRMLHQDLDSRLSKRRPNEQIAVLLLDLDRFKEVNDGLGHHAGDELLRKVGPRLAGALRERDVVARLGGDEFGIVLGPGADADHVENVARRIGGLFQQPFYVRNVALHVDVSLGIALCPDHTTTREGLLRRADIAMYDAKRRRVGYSVYRPQYDKHNRDRLLRIDQLHAAVAEGRLVCHYQPQFDLSTRAIIGVEALVRWDHPQLGIIRPDDFLPLAQEVGLMAPLTRRVLDLALAECRRWRDRGLDWTVSVNVSGSSLSEGVLSADVRAALARHGAPASSLVLEITEGIMADDPQQSEEIINELRALGVRLSIDDYGTGYASMTQLRRVLADELKLDRSYIKGFGRDPRDTAIVQSTVNLGHALGITVVAEGVETADDWYALAGLGCDVAQGHYLSRPLTNRQLLQLIDLRTPASAKGNAR